MQEIVAVARLEELKPGQMRYVEVDGLPIGLANVRGEIYAFGDSCRHEGGPLSSGMLRDDIVTCPWHGWAYSVRSGKSLVPPVGLRIPTYPVVIEGDTVSIVIEWPDE
jgi:nitrite reductase/ring-hydroxylating ferredoxin subunit